MLRVKAPCWTNLTETRIRPRMDWPGT